MIRRLLSGLTNPPPVRLEGRRCVLRPALSRDWRDWAALRAESRGFLKPWEPTWPADALTKAAFDRRMRRQAREWRGDEAYNFLIFDVRSEELVGGLGLTNVRRGVAQTAMMGYWVGERFARRGYVGEATTLLLDFAFGNLRLHRIEAACLPSNAASRGLLKKLGFSEEGYARSYLCIDGAWCDHILYAMVADDWRRQLPSVGGKTTINA
ncbi:MAG TPA: GNAT family protein [Azospirillaceae bacterium]|nr:GNAT family protein [Azospirillaceae bacterium]